MYEHYGHDHTALVCSFATYHLRSAVRDLGKVLGLPTGAIDKLARLSEGGNAGTVRMELERLPEFQGQADGPLGPASSSFRSSWLDSRAMSASTSAV